MVEEIQNLSFTDGVIVCKHIYQCAIEKTLHGVIEQEQIFYKVHDMLKNLNENMNSERLDELLNKLDMENIYAKI